MFPDMQLGGLIPNDPKASQPKLKKTDQLIFVSGQTNPLLFLAEFDKCRDLKTDKDKMFKLRNFVDDTHKGETVAISSFVSNYSILSFS